jgi:DNA-binding NarL/FixJ family response regulator
MPVSLSVEDRVASGTGAGVTRESSRPATRTAGEESLEPARILVVEDDFVVSLEVEAALAEAGFEVVGIANSAEEAERSAAEQRPDLIVMDIRLATARDGVDAALAIFRSTGIRSIFATAHADPHTKDRASEARPLAWVAKPYSMASLVGTVQQALAELKG